MEIAATSEDILQTLIGRGWRFRDVEEVKVIIQIHAVTVGDVASVETVESELVNMDLRSIGGKSLPDASAIKRSSHHQGPAVLQLVSVKNICQSSTDEFSRNSQGRRLLRFNLTDGQSEITAIEYSPIPSIADDIVPGTKVRLENKAPIHNGILCLTPEAVTILGGLVQSLYEEWQMNRKYSGFSRSSLRFSQKNDDNGPPPFEKLKIEAHQRQSAHTGTSSYSNLTPRVMLPNHVMNSGSNSSSGQDGRNQSLEYKGEKLDRGLKTASFSGKDDEKPSSSQARPKEVAEAVPIQNQAASQKLLQRMNQPNKDDRNYRGSRHRGKERQQEPAFLTLNEWESRKQGTKRQPLEKNDHAGISCDEELARQLQRQFDLEDSHMEVDHEMDAEKLRMNMFNFSREEGSNQRGLGHGGRGRGKRARGRGRGRRQS